MNKVTIDLLNTMDNYKIGVELSNHKDPYVKNKYESVPHVKRYTYLLIFLIIIFSLSSINLVLMSDKYWLDVVSFTTKQCLLLMMFIVILIKGYECNQKSVVLHDTRKTGNPYIEEIKEYYFYTSPTREEVLKDLDIVLDKEKSNRIRLAIQKKSLETIDLFYLQTMYENTFKKSILMKMCNIDSELEKQKKQRKKDLWKLEQMEIGAKELRQHFLQEAR